MKVKVKKSEIQRDGVTDRASALQSVDLKFIPFVKSYKKSSENGIRSFPVCHVALKICYGKQAGKFAYKVGSLGKALYRKLPSLYQAQGPSFPSKKRIGGRKGIRP